MRKILPMVLVFSFLLSSVAFAVNVLPIDMVDEDLQWEGFVPTSEGRVSGTITNISNHLRKAVKLDVWATDAHDTRILWRKSYTVGDMAPGAKYTIQEVVKPNYQNLAKMKFAFRSK